MRFLQGGRSTNKTDGVVRKSTSTNYLNQQALATDCPIYYTLTKMGGRWKAVVLCKLLSGPKRFGELQQLVPRITERMLLLSLREMEADELIARHTGGKSSARLAGYELTRRGQSLYPILEEMSQWGQTQVLAAESAPAA